MKKAFSFLVVPMWLFASVTQADLCYFHFDDPVGDQTGCVVDVVRMDFTFEKTTGEYAILLTADAANPFNGDFRVNINLFNPDTGVDTTTAYPSFFSDAVNDYYSVSPVSTFTLTGIDDRLTFWEIGDRVAISDVPFGNPTSSIGGFESEVLNLPLLSPYPRDRIAYGNLFAVICDEPSPVVPVPAATVLATVGLGYSGWRLHRRRDY